MEYMHTVPIPTDRPALLARLAQPRPYDLAIIGGGATGLGVALDAAERGLNVILLESHDFAQGSSSRSTKLAHGGVRYLAQGRLALVRAALHERSALLHNAPHLAGPLSFVLPSYTHWETSLYGLGLKLYEALAGADGLGATEFLSRSQTLACLPNIRSEDLKGGVQYWDGQFDDARLALALARTAASRGALLLNYCAVTDLIHASGRVVGLHCQDSETSRRYTVRAGCVINATGVWVDDIRRKDEGLLGLRTTPLITPSQGVHVVVDRSFLPGNSALLIPRTRDARVLFAIPWLGKVVLGTSDTPRHDVPREPAAFKQELELILGEAARYLERAPSTADIKSIWVGLRPLVKPKTEGVLSTRSLSREHLVQISQSGLVTVTGGKWTSYRSMAQDVLERCLAASLLAKTTPCQTQDLPLIGAHRGQVTANLQGEWGLDSYGTESQFVGNLPGSERQLGGGLTEAMVRFAARYEYARCTEDVLARRSRLLFLDALLSGSVASSVAEILHQEGVLNPRLEDFSRLAQHYLQIPS